MKTTWIGVGLAAWVGLMAPFLLLAKLSLDIRGYHFLGRFSAADMELPTITESLWLFGAVGWWSFLTPVALAVALAAALRKPLPVFWLALLVIGSVIQFAAIHAAILPYYKMTSIMGHPLSVPVPTENLLANLALLGTSIGLAVWSVAVAVKRGSIQPSETK